VTSRRDVVTKVRALLGGLPAPLRRAPAARPLRLGHRRSNPQSCLAGHLTGPCQAVAFTALVPKFARF
jgi:hypothetical protein